MNAFSITSGLLFSGPGVAFVAEASATHKRHRRRCPPQVPTSRKLPILDFAPSPNQYGGLVSGNGNRHNGSKRKPAHGIDLSPRLELSLQCEVECEIPEEDGFNP